MEGAKTGGEKCFLFLIQEMSVKRWFLALVYILSELGTHVVTTCNHVV
jgi:hypothetical protein